MGGGVEFVIVRQLEKRAINRISAFVEISLDRCKVRKVERNVTNVGDIIICYELLEAAVFKGYRVKLPSCNW